MEIGLFALKENLRSNIIIPLQKLRDCEPERYSVQARNDNEKDIELE